MSQRILVADDEAGVRKFAERALNETAEPVEVLGAADGREAVALAREQAPDLILLDIGLPVRDGWGVMTALRAAAATRDIPVMIISGRDEKECRELGRLYGAADFLHKPFRPAELRARVQKIFARSAQNDPLTGFAGPQAFEAEVARRLQANLPAKVLRIDIEGYEGYAAARGAEGGDKVVAAMADILHDAVRVCTTDGFIGRKAEGTFALLARPFEARVAAQRIVSRFELALKSFYPAELFPEHGPREYARPADQMRLTVTVEPHAPDSAP